VPAFACQIGGIYLPREGILSGDDSGRIFLFLEMQGIIDLHAGMIREMGREKKWFLFALKTRVQHAILSRIVHDMNA